LNDEVSGAKCENFASPLELPTSHFLIMGKDVPRSFEKLRSGEQIQFPVFATAAAANAAGMTAVKYPRRLIYLTAGLSGTPCLAISDGTAWKAIPIAGNAS
jgi:hypothetical protein